jgi:hypothetical protein
MQSITFYPVHDEAICPHTAIRAWLGRKKTTVPTLFVHPTSQQPLAAKTIAKRLHDLLIEAGISEGYGPYSIKHAVITYLYSKRVEEVQINEFGRWSLTSRVPAAYYRISTGEQDWLGYRIAEGQ